MIVDTVGGIYQNTLTIAQSVTGDNLYGLYSCTVENSRGSSNRNAFFVYGKTVETCVVRDIHITEDFDCYTGCRLLSLNVSTIMWWSSLVVNDTDRSVDTNQ